MPSCARVTAQCYQYNHTNRRDGIQGSAETLTADVNDARGMTAVTRSADPFQFVSTKHALVPDGHYNK